MQHEELSDEREEKEGGKRRLWDSDVKEAEELIGREAKNDIGGHDKSAVKTGVAMEKVEKQDSMHREVVQVRVEGSEANYCVADHCEPREGGGSEREGGGQLCQAIHHPSKVRDKNINIHLF